MQRMQKFTWKLGAAAAVLLLAAGGGAWWWSQGRAPDVSYRTAKIERGSLQASVSASGTVNPVTQVSVGTQVSGQIKDLLVDFNSEVKAGQLIARIDPETFEYRVRQAQADLDSAQAAVLTAQANSAAARAGVSRARVDFAEAQRDLERKRSLVEKQFISQTEAERAQALVNTTRESVASAEAQLGVAAAQVKSAQASVAQRQAALAQARVDLQRTQITSPVNGIVIKRAVERGQTVAASLQAPELFVIAQNLQDMQVEASIDESDVSRIRLGQRATFTVDAFPGQNFEGEIRQVRKAAQNVANVVTYVAVIGFSNTGGRLLPGMTANVRVVTETREGALKVPNAALRVRIAGVEPAQAPADAAAPPAAATTGPGAGSNAATEFRNRLVSELRLDAAQTEKLDAIYAEARPKFAQLRELPAEERGKARERVMGDIRARIGELLTPEQKAKYQALATESAGRTVTRGRIYLLDSGGKPRAFNVRLGISDGTSTELLPSNAPEASELKEGATVITGVVGATAPKAPSGPRMPF